MADQRRSSESVQRSDKSSNNININNQYPNKSTDMAVKVPKSWTMPNISSTKLENKKFNIKTVSEDCINKLNITCEENELEEEYMHNNQTQNDKSFISNITDSNEPTAPPEVSFDEYENNHHWQPHHHWQRFNSVDSFMMNESQMHNNSRITEAQKANNIFRKSKPNVYVQRHSSNYSNNSSGNNSNHSNDLHSNALNNGRNSLLYAKFPKSVTVKDEGLMVVENKKARRNSVLSAKIKQYRKNLAFLLRIITVVS